MTNVLSDYYYSLVNTLNHTKSLKLKDHLRKDGVDCCDIILLNIENIESDGAFNPEHLSYIISIFEDTSDSIFHLWETQKYKEVMEFLKKTLLCDKDVMETDDIITYGLLVQE